MRLLMSAVAALMILAGSQFPAQAGAAAALAAKPFAGASQVQHVRAWRRGHRHYPRFYGYVPRTYGYNGYYGYPGDYYAGGWGYRSYGWGRPYLYGVPQFWGPRHYGPRYGFYRRRW